MRKIVARCLTLLPLAAGVLAGCEHSVTTVNKPALKPAAHVPVVRASVANGLPLGLTGNTGVGQYIVCSVGADASYSWSSTAWGPTKVGGFSDTAKSGTATVANGGASAPAAWGSGKCVAVYSYPQIDQHQFMKPLVTSTWQAQAGIQLDSIVQDSLQAQDLSVATGPLETISSHPGASTLTAVTNNDYGEIVFYYFSALPSLTLSKTADAATVSAGSAIGFTLTAANAGPGVAHGVSISDPLPAGAGISWSIAPANAACSITSGTLACAFGDVAAGATVSVHVTSPTTVQSCGKYDNTGSLEATGVAPLQASASTVVQCPSLTLSKKADAASVSAGSPIGFTMTVSNTGQGTAANATLSDPLPAGPGIAWSISPANAACSIASGTLSCSFGDLAAGASASVHVTSPTTPQSCATYNNTATAQANGIAAIQASASTQVLCPNLNFSKVADAASVSAGNPIGFTLTVTNSAGGTAGNVTLSDPLPTGSGIAWSISPANAACAIAGGTLSCSFGDLAAGASASVHVTSPTTLQSCAVYNNTATVQATGLSPLQAGASTTVQCPSLKLVKTADAGSVNSGTAIGFTMTISNTGSGAAQNVTLSDPLPVGSGLSWSISPANAACAIASGTLSCSFGTLAAGASVSVHITSPTTSKCCATVTNTAWAQATGLSKISASASTTVNCSCGTRTIGYWKTHAGFGPQADVVTPLLPQWLGTAGGTLSVKVTTAAQAVTLLSMSGNASNAVNKLYAQLLAAKLNIAAGTDGSAVATTISAADAFLATHNAASPLTSTQKQQVLYWMTTLDNYNNGLIGPGHCN